MSVSRAELETYLTQLEDACRDPNAGLFGPGSWMWKVSRESILFLGGGRAALLQLAHPYVATAVKHHSRSESDLPGRFQRTFMNVFCEAMGYGWGTSRNLLVVAQWHRARHFVIEMGVDGRGE